MSRKVHPRHLKHALHLLRAEPARAWTLDGLAVACGVAPRTLQKHFRRFVGRTPLGYLRDIRFELARDELRRGPRNLTVTEVAARCGLNHSGRFAISYRQRYGETPSETRRPRRVHGSDAASLPLLLAALERPRVAVLPFNLVGPEARFAAAMAEGIASSILRLRWIVVSATPDARYRVSGKVHGDGNGRLRVTVILIDASTDRVLWADHWDGSSDSAFEFEERAALRIARAIEPALRDAEIDRVSRKEPDDLSAWDLTMRALPGVLSYEPNAERRALEFLEQAMELAPNDPLPVSLAAWCHGVRGCLHFSVRPGEDRRAALQLAARASSLAVGDVLTETALAAGYTLAHDLATAGIHADRALTLDGGSAWAWSRSGWISAYSGDGEAAIERLQIARSLAPADPLSARCCFGIASAHLLAGRYDEEIRWIKRGIAEGASAASMTPFLAAAYGLENRKEEAREALAQCKRIYPSLTIAQLRSGLPFGGSFFDRVAEGLESAGLSNPH
jgi:AraC-like DNA-binding protein/TolB-like protein